MAVSTKSIKTAYPMDSKVTETGADGLPVYDRAYNARDLRAVMSLALTDGVFPDEGDELVVSQSAGVWSVGTGVAVCDGLIVRNDEPFNVISQSDVATGKYAYVIVAGRFDSGLRDGAIYAVVTEEATYEPERTESVWEVVLARVDWRGGFRDLRLDPSYCGAVAPVVPVDTDSFMAELKTAVSQFNLNVGEVESLPSGTDPTVTVRKPEVAGGQVYVDFGIPRGAPGEPGRDGDSAPTMWVQDEEPPRKEGSVWLVDDRSTNPHAISAVRVYELARTFPGASTFPSDSTFPGGAGSWVDHVFSPALFPGSGGGAGNPGANLVTLSEADPSAPGTPGDVHVNIATGSAFVYE